MDKSNLKNVVEKNIYDNYLNHNVNYELKSVDAIALLNKKRFDSIAKYIYAKSFIEERVDDWANYLYREHLRYFNRFFEVDNFIEGERNKYNYSDFKKRLDKLILSIASNNYNSNISVMPIGECGTPINGSHRLGVCLALNKKITTVKLPVESFSYDYGFLREQGCREEILDNMALEYGKLRKDFFTAIVFPIADKRIKEIETVLSSKGDIFYKKEISLNRNGIHNLVLQMYRDHPWIVNNDESLGGH